MADVLTVEPDEEVEQIRARLARVQCRQVYLYLPRSNSDLRRWLSLALLRRTAEDLGLDITIVTRDAEVRMMADVVGFPTQRRLADAPISNPLSPISILQSPASAIALALGLLLLGLVLAVLVLPSARISVIPAMISLERTVEVQAEPSLATVDVPGRRIPARRLEVTLERQAQAPVSVRREVPDARARGTVVFINQGEDAVEIPAGATVRKADGSSVAFRTLEGVTLPGPAGTTVRVPVEAVSAGVAGNLPAYTLDLLDPALGLPVAVVNDRPISGGSMRQVSVVTEAERIRVRDELLAQMRQEALQTLKAQVHEEETLIDASIEFQVTDEAFSAPVGAEADTLVVDLTVHAAATAVDLDHARQVAEEMLRGQVPAGYGLVAGSLVAEPGPVSDVKGGVVYLQVAARATAQAQVSKRDIKYAVRGWPVDEAARVLSERFPLAAEPRIDVSHGWLGRMPWLTLRIDIEVRDSMRAIEEN